MKSIARLHYYPLYARGQAIRLFLSHLKIQYEDVLIVPPFASQQAAKDWNKIKANYEFRAVPMLQIDGYKLSQSISILRYLAAKHDYSPKQPYDIWRNQSLVDHYSDIHNGIIKTLFAPDRDAAMKEFIKSKLMYTFQALENRLNQNSSQDYFVGEKLTVSDVLWVNFFWSTWMNPLQEKKKLQDAQSVLRDFQLLNDYVGKRKSDFPRIQNRKPQPF